MFFSSIKEINRYVKHLLLRKTDVLLWFYRKENLKTCTTFEEQKGTKYIRGNVYFGTVVFICLSSTKKCLRFLLICLDREIKGFYQSYLGNEADFMDIMNVSPQISWLKIKISKNWDTVLYIKEQWVQRH